MYSLEVPRLVASNDYQHLTCKARGFMQFADNAGPDQPVHMRADQGLHCPFTESMANAVYVDK